MQKLIISLIAVLSFTACSSTESKVNDSEFVDTNKKTETIKSNYQKELDKLPPKQKERILESQKKEALKAQEENVNALKARGFYMNPYGDVNYVNGHDKYCNNLELQSHRGHVNYPENSLESIKAAVWNNFDVIEIDVRVTKDHTWVLHHDSKTGRATGTFDNKQREIYKTKDKDLGYIAHRDMETGKLIQTRIPTAVEAFKLFSLIRKPNQLLNIEIKEHWYKPKLETLEFLAFQYLPEGSYYFSSSDFDNLVDLRTINPDIRLNYILPVAFDSLLVEKNRLKKGVADDPIYEREKRENRFDDSFENEEKARNNYNKRLKKKNSDFFYEKIGPNYSFSADIRYYKTWDNAEINSKKKYGAQISTFSINGQKYHTSVLKSLPKSRLPDSVIIDDTVYGFCTTWKLPPKKDFSSNNDLANSIYNLPLDIDLERINELATYSKSGLYPAIGGSLKPYEIEKKQVARKLTAGKRQAEESFELATDKKVKVELRNEQ